MRISSFISFCFVFLLSSVSVQAASVRDVIISEIAWMGTAASANDEWIELYNSTGATIDLAGWTLAASDGTPSISLSGTIAAGGYFLLERTDDTSISDVAADLTYAGALGNTGEILVLTDSLSAEIDRVDAWHAGNNTSKASMERIRSDVIGTEPTNWANNNGVIVNGLDAASTALAGTPRAQNSVYAAPADVTAPTDITNMAATAGDTQISLSWTASASVDTAGYKLFVDAGAGYDAGTDLVNVTSTTKTGLTNGTTYIFKITAYDAVPNESVGVTVSAVPALPDTTAPTDSGSLSATAGDTQAVLSWSAASDDTAVTDYKLYLDAGSGWDSGTSLGNVTSTTKTGLTNGTAYTFKITARDAAGNESTGISASATPQGVFTIGAAGEVFISEVAWAGSSSSSSDEWLELQNTTSKTFDLTHWVLAGAATSGGDLIISSGTLAAGGYFLIANNTATHSFSGGTSVLNIAPDVVSSSVSLSNSALQVILKDSAGTTIDTAGDGSVPLAGDSTTPSSMARKSSADGTAAVNWIASSRAVNLDAGKADLATPAAANFLAHDIAVSALTSSTAAPLPGESITFTATIQNTGLNTETTFKIEFWDGDPSAGGSKLGEQAIDSLASFTSTTATQAWAATSGSHTIYARTILTGDELATNDTASLALSVAQHLVLSEIVPNPAGTDAAEEWIELYNPTASAVDLTGWRIGGITLNAASIDASGFAFVKADGSTGLGWTGSWTSLNNSAGTVELRDAADNLVDSFSYTTVTAGGSHARADGTITSWIALLHPTQGTANIETNQLPTAVITVQGSGNTSGNCNLYVNLTAEESADADGDALTYSWDFGNGETSSDSNPAGFYYPAGGYAVSLTANDSLGTATASQSFTVSTSCGGGSPSVAAPAATDEPYISSIAASRVQLLLTEVSVDAAADWAEVFVVDDGAGGQGVDLGGFYFESDKNIKTIPKNTIAKTGEFIIVTFKSDLPDDGLQLYSSHSGLTKTDEQLALRDSTGTIEDVLVWANQDGAWSRGEDADIAEIAGQSAWDSLDEAGAVSSAELSRDVVFARYFVAGYFADLDTAQDWFMTPFATAGAPSGLPPRQASAVEMLITRVEPKNPSGDRIEIDCLTCTADGTDLTGFFLKLGQATIYTFPVGTQMTKDEPLIIDSLRLTGVDGMLTLKDFENTTEDFVCWTDRTAPLGSRYDFDLTIAEVTQLEKRARNGQWESDNPTSCLDSRELVRGASFVRTFADEKWLDTHAQDDWHIDEPREELAELLAVSSDAIRLSELVPNPIGEDAGAEWFELRNIGSTPIDLFGWQVTVGASSYLFEDATVLAAGEFRAFIGLLSIRNSGGTLQLFDPDGQLMDSIAYPSMEEGMSYARSFAGWEETSIGTPNAPNGFFDAIQADTDGDGLSDELEISLGTNPHAFDTDGDQLPDRFELEIASDPTIASTASPEHVQQYRQQLTDLSHNHLLATADASRGVVLAGRGVPGGHMRLFLQSELRIIDVPVSADGLWSYTLDTELEAGEHHLFMQSLDPAGFAGIAERILDFSREHAFTPPHFADGIIISEVLPNPTGNDAAGEFIEIQNTSTIAADLTDWQLSIGSKKFVLPAITLQPGELRIFTKEETGLTLPNVRGTVSLGLPTGKIVSSIGWRNAKDDRSFTQLGETVLPTPAAKNIMLAPKTRIKKVAPFYQNGDLSRQVFISEVLPNPLGSDNAAEFIELWNAGDSAVNLGNWQLTEAGGKIFTLSNTIILQPGARRIFTRRETKLALNNAGNEFVELRDFQGTRMSKVGFADVPEGSSFAREDERRFRKTARPTPAAPNIFDTQRITGTVRFVSATYLILETDAGEVSIHLADHGAGLMARAVMRAGDRFEIFAHASAEGFVLADFRSMQKIDWQLHLQITAGTHTALPFGMFGLALACGLFGWRRFGFAFAFR